MTKRIMFGGLLLLLASCGGDSKDVDKESGDGGSKTHPVTGSGGSGGSSSSSGGSSGSSSSSSSSDGGPGSSTAGNNSGSGDSGSGGSSSTPGAGTAPTDGSQLAQCTRNSDCDDGLNCYTFGRYCSAACATDADCASLGSGYTCNARTTTGGGIPGGGGAFPGGGMMGADAAAPMPTGTCRLECTGTSDMSCPSGMSCVSVGGGFTGGGFPGGMGSDAGTTTMGTFRCQYPMQAPTPRDGGTMGGDMMGSGDTPAFGQCSDDSDCADGLSCTAGRTSSGYCTETCMMAADCTMMPGSGTATAACTGGNCTLSCAAMGSTCPDGMTCIRRGGGGGPMGGTGTATCGFMSTTTMMPGGGFPGGGG